MAQLRGPSGFYTIAANLSSNISTALADSMGGDVARACVVPGEIVWDDCSCGLLAISVRNWNLTDEFPDASAGFGANSTTRTSPCDLPWLVGEFQIQIVRCSPTPQGKEISVPCASLDAAAQILYSDAYVTLTETVSTLCEYRETDQIIDYLIGGQDTVGPEADCVGSSLTATVALMR